MKDLFFEDIKKQIDTKLPKIELTSYYKNIFMGIMRKFSFMYQSINMNKFIILMIISNSKNIQIPMLLSIYN
ncbi:hypothetical protein [Candidatus Endomicrobiellum trichonymphae]|uniref:hypothetical protein n=1 Tax=Endomicrobium trichonymphae TaxID=1408204 RepID=UPI0003257786|nr:hypothetical protein [Candidatus Endomicrobium trichonymphae]